MAQKWIERGPSWSLDICAVFWLWPKNTTVPSHPTPALLLTLDTDNRSTGLFARAYSRMWEAPGAERAVTVGLRAAF